MIQYFRSHNPVRKAACEAVSEDFDPKRLLCKISELCQLENAHLAINDLTL